MLERAVLCDLGGVLVLYDEAQIVRKIQEVSSRSLQDPEVGRELLDLKERFDRGLIAPEAFFREIREILGITVPYERFLEVWCDNFTLNEEAVADLRELRRGRKLALVSNTDILHWRYLDDRFRISDLFDAVVVSCEVGSLKPEPEIYERALAAVRVPPERAVFVDDLEENVRGAEALGMKGVVYRPGMDLVREVERVEAQGASGAEEAVS